MGRGPLVQVKLEPGRYVKMHKEDAIDAGLLSGKKREPKEDKMLRPSEDKQEKAPEPAKTAPEILSELETAEDVDDFTVIPGVGPSTAEDLWLLGFRTLEELQTADLSALDGRARRAIERWRDADG